MCDSIHPWDPVGWHILGCWTPQNKAKGNGNTVENGLYIETREKISSQKIMHTIYGHKKTLQQYVPYLYVENYIKSIERFIYNIIPVHILT